MNLSALSSLQLAELIREASAELAARLAAPEIQRVRDEPRLVVLREPPEEDKVFVLKLKTFVSSGGYATAADRNRIADLATSYGPWIARQGLPTERGTGPWRKLAEGSRINAARER